MSLAPGGEMVRSNDDDDRIRQTLAAGDPAADDADLTPEERRVMLASLHRSARQEVVPGGGLGWMRPLAVGGTVALVLLLSWWSRSGHELQPAVVFPVTGAMPQAVERPSAVPEGAAPASPALQRAVPFAPAGAARRRAGALPASQPSSSTEEPAAPVRMIAKGGTKIVWVLSPNAQF
jgi:hypothetical protein